MPIFRLTFAAALGIMTCQAMAQDSAMQAVPVDSAPTESTWEAPEFTDPEFQKVADLITGSWKSDEPLESAAGTLSSTVHIHITPIRIAGLPNAFYFEASRADEPQRPYRQMVFSLWRYEGEPTLRVYDFRQPIKMNAATRGTWALPELFPDSITPEVLFPTIDIPLTSTRDGFRGGSDRPQPIMRGGAVKLNTEVEFSGSTLEFNDRGFGADGQVVWGPAIDESQIFQRLDAEPTITRTNDGLIVLHYMDGEGEPYEDGQWIHMHYAGYLTTGDGFDSSRARGEPYRYQAPGRLIAGWRAGVVGMTEGSARRLWIPPALGYGEGGVPNAGIAGNATLVFDVELMHVER